MSSRPPRPRTPSGDCVGPLAGPLAGLALGLAGCGSVAGDWQGDLLCLDRAVTQQGDATLFLVDDRGGEFDGELRVEGEYQSSTLRGAMVMSWDIELEKTRLAGDQELDHLLGPCALYIDGQLAQETCPAEAQDWRWDGSGELSMQSATCQLLLTR